MKQGKTPRRRFLFKSIGSVALAASAAYSPSTAHAQKKNTEWSPMVSENIRDLDESTLRWMAQIGLKHVAYQGGTGIDLDNKGYWNDSDIISAQKKCAAHGMKLVSLMLPLEWVEKNNHGEQGRDEEIERLLRSIKAAGEAGIPMLEWRSARIDFFWDERVGYHNVPGRGGASYLQFDYDIIKDKPPFEKLSDTTKKEMWERWVYLGKPIIAAAEKAGVKLSVHPNDPPLADMRGVPRILTKIADFERFYKEIPSPSNGLTFCQGTFHESGEDVIAAIRKLGSRIHHVHLRAVRGTIPKYTEVFIDEGDVDMFEALRTYKEIGYNGTIVSDHTPGVEGGSIVGRSFSHGYIRAMIQAINKV